MRFEPRRTFASARPLERRPAARDLPADLAFVETYGVSRDDLQTAAARAVLDGTDGRRALLADGAVSEAYYYRALAWHLGVPFIDAWPRIAEPADLRDTLARGTARLVGRDRSWLIAPESAGIRTLVAARSLALTMPKIAITTPTHFAALVGHRAQARIARRASLAFPAAAPRLSAHRAVTPPVAATVVIALLALLGGIYVGSRVESDLLGLVFLAGLVFRLFVFGEGLPHAPVVEDDDIPDRVLPTYSVLVPLRDEVEMVPDLVAALAALDYPSAKREVLFLVESDDAATRTALAGQRLPAGFRIVDLPPGLPRTKPRALNVGLLLARGELVTIYDAEDRPEQNQLRRAACRFVDAPDSLACLQARLAIVNGPQGLLPNLFAIEYAGLFDIFNVGLGRRGLPMALGGTSNHFRASALRAVGGWDAWNVTEDADLGLRLARFGYAIDVLVSTTFEEAPERLGLWFKQRRRWTKGWMQTLVVLARDLPDVIRDLGPKRTFVVALLLTNLVTGPLLTPIFLVLVAWHLATQGVPNPHGAVAILEATLAFAVIFLGGAGTLWQAWVGARRRGLSCWRALPAVLPYQLMIAAAAWAGLFDLACRPHHWHKTPHGTAARRVRRPASAASPPA